MSFLSPTYNPYICASSSHKAGKHALEDGADLTSWFLTARVPQALTCFLFKLASVRHRHLARLNVSNLKNARQQCWGNHSWMSVFLRLLPLCPTFSSLSDASRNLPWTSFPPLWICSTFNTGNFFFVHCHLFISIKQSLTVLDTLSLQF